MKKVSEDQFFKELFENASKVERHVKDSIYDFGTIKELELSEKGYHIEIFYRDLGTWVVNHNSEQTPDKQGRRAMKENSDYSIDYMKEYVPVKRWTEVQYSISEKKPCKQ